MAQTAALPVMLVLDHDPHVLDVLLSDLSRRFGNAFTAFTIAYDETPIAR
jgi:hypothetical protein